jgi:hypothetical protein
LGPLENIFDEDACQAHIEAIERVTMMLGAGSGSDPTTVGRRFSEPHLFDQTFLDLLRIPGLIAACRQLIGHDHPRYHNSSAAAAAPHQDRHTRRDALKDPQSWEWHRNFRPKMERLPT